MFNTNDIFLKIGLSLNNKNFYELSVEKQKQLVEKEMIYYIKEKVGNIEKETLDEIVLNLGQKLKNSVEKEKLLTSCISFLLNIAEDMQNMEIAWQDREIVQEQSVLFDKDGKWDSLITQKYDLIENKFMFALDVFRNYFLTEDTKIEFMVHNSRLPYVKK